MHVRHHRCHLHLSRTANGSDALGFAQVLQGESHHASSAERQLCIAVHSSHPVGEAAEQGLFDRTHVWQHEGATVSSI